MPDQRQYTLKEILGIWLLAAVPMGLLTWVVAPDLMRHIPLHSGIFYWILMILGMVWQCALALWIIYNETGSLKWAAIRKRTWLNLPKDPNTGKARWILLLWLIPCLLFSVIINLIAVEYLDRPMTELFPFLSPPAYTNMAHLATPQFAGEQWLLLLVLVHCLFNYFLGEELLFRGVLLPRMQGVFGKWDWVANAVLFGLYHFHKPWAFPSMILSALAITWPARRFQSTTMAILVHGADGLFLLFFVFSIIVGR